MKVSVVFDVRFECLMCHTVETSTVVGEIGEEEFQLRCIKCDSKTGKSWINILNVNLSAAR